MSETKEPIAQDELESQSGPNWEDPSVAVGNAPPMPGWPLAIAVVAWVGGIIFLLAMMAERLS